MHPILGDRRRLQIHLAAWTLAGAMLAVLVRAVLGAPWISAFAFGLPLGLAAAPISLSAWYLCRAMPLSRTPVLRLAAASMGAAAVTAAIWAAVGGRWSQAIAMFGAPAIDAPPPALFTLLVGFGALAYLLALAATYLVVAFEDSAEASRRVLESQVAQREAELTALRAQIDPHFLFNSLNSIAGLATTDPARAREMCQLLADFLRDSMTLGSAATISLGREVALAQQYLRIEQIRFGSRLTVEASVTDDSAGVGVPPLLLQPLVENAVRHGIATRLEGGRIEITASCAGERAVVTVTNPRDEDGARRGTGFGLGIVRRRLAAAFGDAAALVLEPQCASYRATVTVPIGAASPSVS
jgi:signal transduction histidine kinase